MEINFENRTIDAYKEMEHQTKRIQIDMESVVPDTDEDIGKVATVQTRALLKSKDNTVRGVLISGEVSATLVYITEDQQRVSFVNLVKSFSIEYDVDDIDPEVISQINISVLNADARVINPRKVSIAVELSGELNCYRLEKLCVETSLPRDCCAGVHARSDSAELILANTACEKTFAVNEQFIFPSGKPCPHRLVSQKVDFVIGDTQLIGRKMIIKGSAELSICYLSQDVNYPVNVCFSAAFSQIIEIGDDSMDCCSVLPEMTSCYFDLIDTVGGEKALDAEIHGVLQVVCRSRKRMIYVADAYSNLMPAKCGLQNCQYKMISEHQKLKLSADERITVFDDCADVLSAFVSVAHISQEQTKLRAEVNIDIIYRANNGLVSAVKRGIGMEGECGGANIRILSSRLADVYLRPDSQFVDAHISVELCYLLCAEKIINRVESLCLDEEEPFDLSQYPTVSLVKAENECLWELAKTYHSSIDKISSVNDLSGELTGKMLLIPKSI